MFTCVISHTGRVGREENSLFVYRGGDTYSSVNNDTGFTPRFGVDLDSIPDDVKVACDDNMQCLYDFVQTGDLGLAKSTASEEMELQDTRNILGQCTAPNVLLCIYCSHLYVYCMYDDMYFVLLCLNCFLLTS